MAFSIAILLAVHNRKTSTLKCLELLTAQCKLEGYDWDIYITDDGCTDGTPEAILELYPGINIVKGNGDLFWNRGMYVAWDAAARAKRYDFFLWLNDDTLLFPNAIETMVKSHRKVSSEGIVCGATCSEARGEVTYSGWLRGNNVPILPNGDIQECQIVNGNFLLVPNAVFQSIGNLDWTFRHAIGDFDYGLRAQKAGFKCYVASEFIGTCEANPTLPKWCLKSTPIWKRFQILYSPLGYAEPIPFFIYERRHFGVSTALKHFASINLRALLPGLWK